MGVRHGIAGGVFLFLVIAGSCLLILGLKHGGWVFAVAGFLIEAGYLGIQWLTGGKTWVERVFVELDGWVGRWRYRRAESQYRQKQESETTTIRLGNLEERVNELVEQRIHQRLAELERAEALRSGHGWSELRDVWRVLMLDPKTPEEIRAACREWLAKYPETLDLLPQRLQQMGLLTEKDLLLDDNWKRRERHKWRVQ